MTKLYNRFVNIPDFDDDESNLVARLTVGIAIGLICFSILLVVVVQIAFAQFALRALALGGVLAIGSLGAMLLIQKRRLRISGSLLVTAFWFTVTFGSITGGGILTPVFVGYIIVIIIGNMILEPRAGTIASLGCIGSGFLITLAELLGYLPAPIQLTTAARFVVYTLFFIIVILLQHANKRNLQELFAQTAQSEKRYKTLLENIPITTYINTTDEAARIEYVSPQVEALTGYARSEFLTDQEFWKKILHPEDYERVIKTSAEGSISNEPFNMEYRLITRDEHTIWVKDEANLVRDDQNQPLYWLGAWTDITVRKQAEEEQANLISEMTKRTIQLQTAAEVSRAASSILDLNTLLPNVVELIRSHFDYYYVGIFLVDEYGEWAILSAATGEAGRQMLASGHKLKIEDSSMIGWCIKNRQARIALDVGEDAVRFKNPHLPLTRSEMALPLVAHTNVIGAMTIQSALPAAFASVDITTLQTMANQIANTIENARLFTERASLIQELEARNSELEQFTYTVSHDLRSPLVTIRGFLGYLQQDVASGDMIRFAKDLNRIANAVDKMQALLNDLLELSRIGRIINPPEFVPFGHIVHEAVELLAGLLDQKQVNLIAQEPLPSVYGDHPRLVEVMQNLISNAVKFMGEQTKPIIEVGTHGADLDEKPIFFVRDNGMGIDPQYHDRIFGLFNRLDPTIDGTGIGLTLVKRIIEIHGGHIWLESQLGRGTTFYFTLPQQ
jgi:PAS domain S-box-containing protein